MANRNAITKTIQTGHTDKDLNITAQEVTSDEALLSHLIGQIVRTNLNSQNSNDTLLLAAVTESFLVFQNKMPDGSTVTTAWSRDYVRRIDFRYQKWCEQEVTGTFRTKVISETKYEFFGTITLDHNEPATIDKKRTGGGVAVGAVWTGE